MTFIQMLPWQQMPNNQAKRFQTWAKSMNIRVVVDSNTKAESFGMGMVGIRDEYSVVSVDVREIPLTYTIGGVPWVMDSRIPANDVSDFWEMERDLEASKKRNATLFRYSIIGRRSKK